MNFDVAKLPEVLRLRVMNLMAAHMQIVSSVAASPIYVRITEADLEKVERIRKERDAILELTEGAKEVVTVKATPCSYCVECRQNFEPQQFVHYMVHDNDCICVTCSEKIQTEKEPRFYDPNYYDHHE